MDFNKIILLGRLTRDPQVKYSTGSGTAYCTFGMATNRYYNSQDGERKSEVCFVDCKAFGRTAEVVGEYTSKGAPLLIEGHLSYYSWEDEQTGQKRSRLSVIAERAHLMGKRKDEEAPPDKQEASAPAEATQPDKQPLSQDEALEAEDEIPF